MRYFVATVSLLVLAACGGGQGSYDQYLREREAAGQGSAAMPGAYSPITGAPVSAAPLDGGPATGGSSRLSDEQNFDAVAARESIESDRERLERQRAQYVFIEPTTLPERSGAEGPNVIQYALSTRNIPGQQVHRRMNPFRYSRWEENCAQFATQDQAQIEFLRRGGPERDPANLDPDGDGFACWWDPRPFRAAAAS